MSGPEHYREAERLVEAASTMLAEIGKFMVDERQEPAATTAALPAQTLAMAQVHATLALAASMAPRMEVQPAPANDPWGPS